MGFVPTDCLPKMELKSIMVEFNIQEAKALVGLLDIAVKSAGLAVAADALYFRNKLEAAHKAQSVEPTETKG